MASTTFRAVQAPANRVAFTGARLTVQRPSGARPVHRSAVRPMALFGGAAKSTAGSIYDIKVKSIDGSQYGMDRYKGKVLLCVNVASACGFTPQYTEMAELYTKYSKQGLEIIAQPCNAFGGQEPGSNSEVKSFAARKGFNGPMLAKGEVNGSSAEPLWDYLKEQQGGLLGNDIKWNFTKFLVDRNGKVVKRYPSTTPPLAIENDIKSLL